MLRKIRTILAAICILLITLLFVDFTGMLHTWLGWLAKIQFLPAVLALNAGVILFLVVLTLVSGHIYCSVICPLGIFQDIVARTICTDHVPERSARQSRSGNAGISCRNIQIGSRTIYRY